METLASWIERNRDKIPILVDRGMIIELEDDFKGIVYITHKDYGTTYRNSVCGYETFISYPNQKFYDVINKDVTDD